jgi:hypothetical protein
MQDIIPFLQSQKDQAEAAMRQLVANHTADEILELLSRCVDMNQSDDATQCAFGTFGAYALTSGILSHIDAGGKGWC